MTADTEAAIRHVYEQWHEAVVRRDIEGLMALYVEDAILESPLVWAVHPEHGSGILRGKVAIGDFSRRGSAVRRTALAVGTGQESSSPMVANWHGNIPARPRTATKSIWSR